MMFVQNTVVASVWRRLRTTIGIRFSRFAGASIVALFASTTTLYVCDGLIHMSSTWAAVISWIVGVTVSYILSRWAWGAKGKPNILRETFPFLAVSLPVVIILSLATKLGYDIAIDLHLHGVGQIGVVEFVYVMANFGTFLLRFAIFHYVLFKDPAKVPVAAQPLVTTSRIRRAQ